MAEFSTETNGDTKWKIDSSTATEDQPLTPAVDGVRNAPIRGPVSPPQHIVPGPNDTIFLASGESSISGGTTATAGTWPNACEPGEGIPQAPKI